MRKENTQKGFTLTELMVVVGLSAMIALGMYVMMRKGDDQAKELETKMTIEDSAREGLYKLIQELRLSAEDQVTPGAGGNSITFFTANSASPVAADYTVNWSASSITYGLGGVDGKQLIRTDNSTGTTKVIANDVTSISFTGGEVDPDSDADTDPDYLTITLNVQRQASDGRNVPDTPLAVTGKVDLRN